MMNKNKDNANSIAVNANERSRKEDEMLSNDSTANRNFGIADLWSIRRNVRTLKIHGRMPRL